MRNSHVNMCILSYGNPLARRCQIRNYTDFQGVSEIQQFGTSVFAQVEVARQVQITEA